MRCLDTYALLLIKFLLVMQVVVLHASANNLSRKRTRSGSNYDNRENELVPEKDALGKTIPAEHVIPPAGSQQENFRLMDDGWGPCERTTPTKCGRTLRDVRCIYADRQEVPLYYCDRSHHLTFRPCDHCPEDCVTTVWSEWSDCSATCSPATRYRTRRVLTQARHGGRPCWPEDLSLVESCSELVDCRVEVFLPTYTWKIGEWSSCREDSQSTTVGPCGLGKRLRTLSCVNAEGEMVSIDLCLQGHDPRKAPSLPPAGREACYLPCDCRTTSWSSWGACSLTCQVGRGTGAARSSGGTRTRSREVATLPENGGVPCPGLTEQRPCDWDALPDCPRFEWVTEEWQPCRLAPDNEDTCGAGRQKRQVYCIKAGDLDRVPVINEDSCLNSPSNTTTAAPKPPMKRACLIDCPIDCQLGEWLNWSPCSQSCLGGIQVRHRDVMVAAAHGGAECAAVAEAKECEFVNCSWWYTSRWSSCSLNRRGNTDCGPGRHSRVVYCMSALDELLEDEDCPGETPAYNGDCVVPCPSDCVPSSWSEWEPCSKTCGKIGGTQLRTRQILAYSDPQESSCLSELELVQRRPCNVHISCQTYTWQVGVWDGCTTTNGTTAGCGDGVGVQTRHVSCVKESGVAPYASYCDPASQPALLRPCDVPCPVDCRLSAWSALSPCSETCGPDGRRIRSQRVIWYSAHGGAACPEEADQNGLITKGEPCDGLPPCYSYQWTAANWTDCQVLHGTSCGQGLQSREVQCRRSDGTNVEPGLCLREVFTSPPSSHRPCIVPCAGDCLLSDWTIFGPCLHDCGDQPIHGGYCRERSRRIVSIDPSTDNPSELCPHIKTLDLFSYMPCDDVSLPYSWRQGHWQSCIIDDDEQCGLGVSHRSILCQRSDGTLVPDHFCIGPQHAAKPGEMLDCLVSCPANCIVSEWTDWSPCSQICGQGFQTRARDIQQQSLRGGRGCPFLIDSRICTQSLCDELEWEVSQWGACEVIDPSLRCGLGVQVRGVSCRAGPAFEVECGKRFARPESRRDCLLSCPGDCVMSEWSDVSRCSLPCLTKNATKTQRRTVIRKPTEAGERCGESSRTVPCSATMEEECIAAGYRMVTGEWTLCGAAVGECGHGLRHRTVNCINHLGFPIAARHCGTNHTAESGSETCSIPCHADLACEPGAYSAFSSCNATCGLDGVMVRSRVVVGYDGSTCPQDWPTVQTIPCNAVPCHTYTWERSLWSECHFETERGCGYGERSRRVECRRSDGLTVDPQYCQGGVGVSGMEVDIETTQGCKKACPGDCLVSSWSVETSCLGSCYSPGDPPDGHVTRSRAVIRPGLAGGIPCPDSLIEEKNCSASDAICPAYTWLTGPIDDDITREVWCQFQDGAVSLNVTGGCVEAQRPLDTLGCHPSCSGAGRVCLQGRCTCQRGFEGSGEKCFPTSGCTADDHCPLPHTFCNSAGRCGCVAGYAPGDNTPGDCIESNDIPGDWRVTGLSLGTTAPWDDGKGVQQYQGESDTWKWIVVGSCLGLVLAAIVVAIVIVVRRRRSGEVRFNPIPTISDSDFQLSKLVKDVVTKC